MSQGTCLIFSVQHTALLTNVSAVSEAYTSRCNRCQQFILMLGYVCRIARTAIRTYEVSLAGCADCNLLPVVSAYALTVPQAAARTRTARKAIALTSDSSLFPALPRMLAFALAQEGLPVLHHRAGVGISG